MEDFFHDAQNCVSAGPNLIKQLVIYAVEKIGSFLFQTRNISAETLCDGADPVLAIRSVPDIVSLRDFTMDFIGKYENYVGESSTYSNIVTRAIDYIDKQYMKDIGLLELSDHLGINSGYFSHVFKEKTRESFSSYRNRIRIEKAVEMINRGGMSTDEIARSVGYNNTNYFIKIFKKVTGKTLSEFKNI